MLSPHRPQNRELFGRAVEHRGHGYVDEDSPAVIIVKAPPPQRPQNRTPSAKREPQVTHATIPGITLDGAPLLP